MTTDKGAGFIESPIGPLRVRWQGRVLLGVTLPGGPRTGDGFDAAVPDWLAAAFDAYFQDAGDPFSLQVQLSGTEFQRRVWEALRRIPSGSVRRYGDLAAALGTSARAVGNACRANPCPIVVPCHRVVARHGLGGFAGDTTGALLNIKRWLLQHEGGTTTGVAA